MTDAPSPTRWTLMLHGGAGRITPDTLTDAAQAGARAALHSALDAGAAVLAADGSALDAVGAAIRVLEDDPHFNAGRGAALGHDGRIELDAAIMDGRDRRAGAVAGVIRTRNPISLARAVMEHSPHVLLAGAGADGFAETHGLEQVAPDWFEVPERRAQLESMLADGGDAFDVDMKFGTVGAVASDTAGHVAAATSTGGVTGKRWGRIGDSPVIGAGTWADDRGCAFSATGSGEFFIRAAAGHAVDARVRHLGEDIGTAAAAVLAEIRAMGGTGGVIVAAPDGAAAWRFTTPGMYRAMATADGERIVAIFGDEA
ncbi:isoaspartyl peptidase/L-asparaginase [Sphingomonas sp. KR1UV-12]|uniref:Isoaspartyl peptidase/L-asparaginase n=1 Tax=Sphingomonas aurea TaxID=3063994 RepID=A0ABT9EP31_9SPHN|nr:isoaspartyl peptidase/L-asparaginase [Sphingomonas sp. KR1UV-12]MDP1028561.1 isoaspartyl peptidase/L-asparaginase [Sphingomonas sp. KR1UV-12]